MHTLHQLSRLKQRWQKARAKDQDGRQRALTNIDSEVARRQSEPFRSALPKKKQRALGLLPPVN
jgi:hypothetical protein